MNVILLLLLLQIMPNVYCLLNYWIFSTEYTHFPWYSTVYWCVCETCKCFHKYKCLCTAKQLFILTELALSNLTIDMTPPSNEKDADFRDHFSKAQNVNQSYVQMKYVIPISRLVLSGDFPSTLVCSSPSLDMIHLHPFTWTFKILLHVIRTNHNDESVCACILV